MYYWYPTKHHHAQYQLPDKFALHGVIQENETWQQTEPLLVIFGFKDGKISLIKELW